VSERISINDCFLNAADGTRIAYRVEGTGPALVLTNGLTTTTSFWKYVRPIWLQRHRVVTWDLPGHGNSGPARSDESARMQTQPHFIAQVMQAAGIQRAAQIGWSTGCQVVLEMYRQYSESCSSVVMVLGGAGHALEHTRLPIPGGAIDWLMRHLPRAAFAASYRALATAFRQPGALGLGRRAGMIGPGVSPDDMRELTQHIATLDAHTLQRLTHSSQAHSAHAVAAAMGVPLLIIAGDLDPFAPTELVGLPLHESAPGSQLIRLAEGTHTALLEEPSRIAAAVEQFLADA
jgi:pimeloyl-ACP methyl ester carboxylesterase